MNIEGEYVYFTGTEGNQHLLPKARDYDEIQKAGLWVAPSFSYDFSAMFNYRRPLKHLTERHSDIVRKLCNQQPTYEHYL